MTQAERQPIGIGPTAELGLRVSVASLVRVVFPRPADGALLLGLEHKATLPAGAGQQQVVVKAQPFGGAVRILNVSRLQARVGRFHFDSQLSRSEGDFRILIRPADWEAVLDFCLQGFRQQADPDLESGPARELAEEFHDALGVELRPDQYAVEVLGTILENEPSHSDNVHALGVPTVRVYRIFEARLLDPGLCQAMVANSAAHSSHALRRMALADAQQGGRGRANAVLAAPLEQIRAAYLALPPAQRGEAQPFGGTQLHGNVVTLLQDIPATKYRLVD